MKYVVFLGMALFCLSCSSKKATVQTSSKPEPMPQWLLQRPVAPAYYIGIARVNKKMYPTNYSEEARKKALDDLSSEIEVAIEANSILYTFETSQGHTEDFVQSIKLKSNLQLEGFEMVSSYENDEEYAVYYRLNKAEYQEKEKLKRQQKIEESKSWLAKSEEAQAAKNWHSEVEYRLKALLAIEDYWSEAIKTEWKGNEEFLGSYCLAQLNECFKNLNLSASQNSLRMPYGLELQSGILNLEISAYQKPLKNFTLLVNSAQSTPTSWNVLSNDKGRADMNGFKFASSGQYSIIISPDWKKEFGCSDKLIAALKAGTKPPQSEVKISSETPRILFQFEGEKMTSLIPALQESVRKQALLWAKNTKEADLVCTINLNSREGGELNGLFTAFISVEVNLKTIEGEAIYYKKFDDLKGVDLNYDRAKIKAGESLQKKFQFEILPAIKRKLES